MSHEATIRKYYQAVEKQDHSAVILFFSKDATIVHPIFGTTTAADFFKMLLKQATSANEISIKNIFHDSHHPNRLAVYFSDKVATQEGSTFLIPHGVHVFDFTNEGLIHKITVIYDTFPVRGKFGK